jgi:hypothetical protein
MGSTPRTRRRVACLALLVALAVPGCSDEHAFGPTSAADARQDTHDESSPGRCRPDTGKGVDPDAIHVVMFGDDGAAEWLCHDLASRYDVEVLLHPPLPEPTGPQARRGSQLSTIQLLRDLHDAYGWMDARGGTVIGLTERDVFSPERTGPNEYDLEHGTPWTFGDSSYAADRHGTYGSLSAFSVARFGEGPLGERRLRTISDVLLARFRYGLFELEDAQDAYLEPIYSLSQLDLVHGSPCDYLDEVQAARPERAGELVCD